MDASARMQDNTTRTCVEWIYTSHYANCAVGSIQRQIRHLFCFSHSFRLHKKQSVTIEPRKNLYHGFPQRKRCSAFNGPFALSYPLWSGWVASWVPSFILPAVCFILIIILILIIIMGAYPIVSSIPPTRSISFTFHREVFHQLNNKWYLIQSSAASQEVQNSRIFSGSDPTQGFGGLESLPAVCMLWFCDSLMWEDQIPCQDHLRALALKSVRHSEIQSIAVNRYSFTTYNTAGWVSVASPCVKVDGWNPLYVLSLHTQCSSLHVCALGSHIS